MGRRYQPDEDQHHEVEAASPAPYDADIDHDGKISEREFRFVERRLNTTRKMAIISLGALLGKAVYIMAFMPIDRIEVIGSLLDMTTIVLGGIVATYMGAAAYTTSLANRD